ncbi:signal peptidase I [Paramicrobacterium fandaimingii]|uniref:signal peptidase I n=1 Tax=Paramicrobacterium fandaimingii TaxID=2708079 RepID=UPI001420F8CE|nr:signal peptidase I [Microbacterium fandaimingii]
MTRTHADRTRPENPVLRGILMGLSWGILGLTLLLGILVIAVPKLVGGVPLTVLSGSMEPTLPVGSLVVVRPVAPDDVRVGDIVTYLPNPDDPTAITHRVTAINHNGDGSRVFTFTGDANATADAPVREQQVRAEVWYAIPGLGYVNSAVNGDDTGWVVYAAAGAFFLWAIVLWVKAARTRIRNRLVPADSDR